MSALSGSLALTGLAVTTWHVDSTCICQGHDVSKHASVLAVASVVPG